jgi:RHS repeat-associated protein
VAVLALQENSIYGSQRVGVHRDYRSKAFSFGTTVVTDPNTGAAFYAGEDYTGGVIEYQVEDIITRTNKKSYEFTNHLGNVLSTSSDRKSVLESNEELAEYISQVLSQQDYYPFGMVLPGRSFTADVYRYGFNGMEQDDEVAGEGNSYTTHYRQYDARIARWTSVDPLFSSFSWQSAYAAFDNNPVYYKDPAGAASEGPGGPDKPAPEGSPEGFRQFWDDDGALERSEVFYWHYDDDGTGTGSWMSSGDYRNQIEYLGALQGSQSYNFQASHLDLNVGAWAPLFLIDTRASLYPEEFHDTYAEGFSSGWANAWASYQPAPGNVVMKDYTFDVILLFSTGGVGNGIQSGLEWTFTRAMVGLRSRTFGSFAARGVTTADGFLFRGFTVKTPVNIPVQRFGNMSLGRPDFWGPRIGTSQFANRTFGAIKPSWNPLTQYTTGVIPKGTPIKFGIIGPQGWRYPGGSLQFIAPFRSIINQSSKLIPR